MTVLQILNKKLEEIENKKKFLEADIQELQNQYELRMEEFKDSEEARIIFQNAAQITQQQISYSIENTVSRALAVVFDDPYEFKMSFVQRRNTTECDILFVNKNGTELSPLIDCGFGAADIASLALRVCYLGMSDDLNKILILDEPLRCLSVGKQPLASMMIKELANSGIQFLIVTHTTELAEEADIHFGVTRKNNTSFISEINKKERFKNDTN